MMKWREENIVTMYRSILTWKSYLIYLYCCFLREFLQKFYDSETISSETYYVFSIIELDFETFITNNIKMPDNSKLAPIRENYIINSIELLDKINDYIIKGYELNDLKLTTSIYNYLFSSQELDSEINKKVVFVSGEWSISLDDEREQKDIRGLQ